MLFSELRLQNKNIAYRVVGKPKNPHPERPFEWPLELYHLECPVNSYDY